MEWSIFETKNIWLKIENIMICNDNPKFICNLILRSTKNVFLTQFYAEMYEGIHVILFWRDIYLQYPYSDYYLIREKIKQQLKQAANKLL